MSMKVFSERVEGGWATLNVSDAISGASNPDGREGGKESR